MAVGGRLAERQSAATFMATGLCVLAYAVIALVALAPGLVKDVGITLTPLDAQPEPPNLTALKAELNTIWPMTSLLDMVKETDLRLGFTEALKSPALSTWSSLRKKLGGRNMLPILIRSPLRGLFLGTARLLLIFRQGHR